ncbi:MAG: FapA family protein [Treponema sp.]
MIHFEQIRAQMKEQYERDSSRFFVEVTGATLDEAISNAAVELGLRPAMIDYEILQRGASGFFVLNPRDWKIRAYEIRHTKKADTAEEAEGETSGGETKAEVVNKDGMAYVFCAPDGVFLKVTAPIGTGRRIALADVVEKIRDRNLPVPTDDVLRPIVKQCSEEYVRIGPYDYLPGNDALMSVEISDDEMKAYLFVSPPMPGGADVSVDMIITFLSNNRVISGINEKRVKQFQDSPVYKENYLIAEGSPPQKGEDAKILYNFETDNTQVRLKETKTGQINFKELNLIQNVVEGQPLAQKIPAQEGKSGRTVTGKYLPAVQGKDISLPLGKNTRLAEDNLTVVAETNGQVLLVKNKINVEPIMTIEGNVSVKTGNIMFLGTVFVKGSVDDGFSIKASGNIEVKGAVGKASLDAEGDIVVSQGIIGKEGGYVRAGKSIWSKFIQNIELVEAGDMIIVSDGILNSKVIANHKVICRGKRADIIGSQVTASEGVYARNLGSPAAGSDTVVSVGFDPRSKERLVVLEKKLIAAEKSLMTLKLDLQSLENQKKILKELPEEKEALLKKKTEQQYIDETEIKEVRHEIEQIRKYLATLKTDGRVSISGNIYTGVRIVIKDIIEDVRVDCKATTFFLQNGLVRYGPYVDYTNDDDVKRTPSGYSAD